LSQLAPLFDAHRPGAREHEFGEGRAPAGGTAAEDARVGAPHGAKESDYRPERWKGYRDDYGFTGKEEDAEFGIVYFGKRFYSPQLNRWITADPLAVHRPGKADLNLYAYVSGKVLSSIDPLGLVPPGNQSDEGTDTTGNTSTGPSAPTVAVKPPPIARVVPAETYPGGSDGAPNATPSSKIVVLREITITVDVDRLLSGEGFGGGPAAGPAEPNSIGNGVHGQGENGPEKPTDIIANARGLKQGAEALMLTAGPEIAGALLPKFARLVLAEPELTRSYNAYEVLSEQTIGGLSRGAHRAAANDAFHAELRASPELQKMFDQQLGGNVLEHMESGAGSALRNPPSTVWHHPVDNPDVVQLLRTSEHTNPELQPLLHPGGAGGFDKYYGN
jgi:RHS repeat-associated protein